MVTLSTTLFGELTCLTQRTHCCLGRLHRILIASIPHIVMSEEKHQEQEQTDGSKKREDVPPRRVIHAP